MEIKARLDKPYIEDDRLDFIVKNNHEQGYEIIETETALEAWGYTEQEKLIEAKKNKKEEALSKAYYFEENGAVEYKNCVFEMSLKNRDNLRDTVEALTAIGLTETTWNDKNDELVILTLEDIQYIRLNLILGRIQRLWINDYPSYKEQIANAQTIEDVNSIEIVYN